MKTRKDIWDKDGIRSIYVVEWQLSSTWINDEYEWFLFGSREGIMYASNSYKEAVELKRKAYKYTKNINKSWKLENFRIALYSRVE